ncbi:MAG TPA: limonene-1,2-epoxide hydrolase family protein [Acidimicrobiales bacterium]|nr:limonene-1,2-epoxide hydrolase family protein [Acidimicrobiales bacterium]
MESQESNEETIRRFCAAFSRCDVEELVGFFAPEAVYHNIPLPPAAGIDAIRDALQMFVPASPEIEFEIRNMASSGSVVFTERIDRMTFNGKPVELPVTGVFELDGGLIVAWRDYFDMQMFLGGSDQ